MDPITFIQEVLLVSAVLFIIVLIISYIYSKVKKEKAEPVATESNTKNKSSSTQTGDRKKKMARTYTASADAPKLYVNTEEHKKYVVKEKAAKRPPRFKVINGKKDED